MVKCGPIAHLNGVREVMRKLVLVLETLALAVDLSGRKVGGGEELGLGGGQSAPRGGGLGAPADAATPLAPKSVQVTTSQKMKQ